MARAIGVEDADALSVEQLRAAAVELRDGEHPTRAQAARSILAALDAADRGRVYRPFTDSRER